MKHLKISDELHLPLWDAITQTYAFIARRGAGKTYAASKLCEEMLTAGAQVIILDPVGNWYGLRLAADGVGKGFDIPVFGGLRGDVPLEPGAGAMVADLAIDRGMSMVLDVSMFTQGELRRFAMEFAEHFFHRKKASRSPVHIFIEESQVFVPQRVQPDQARMLGAFEKLTKLGRNFGIGVTLISQRPQSVNKDVLNQTEALFVLQTNGAQERKAIREWIVDQGLDIEDLVDELPGLQKGDAFFWSPSWLKVTKKVHIAEKRTFNASSTPEMGDKVAAAPKELAQVDLEAIRVAMKDVVARAEENDPRALRRRIAELEGKLAKAPAAAPAKVERVEVPVFKDGEVSQLESAIGRLQIAAGGIGECTQGLLIALRHVVVGLAQSRSAPAPMRAENHKSLATTGLDGLTRGVKSPGGLPKAERMILNVLAQYPESGRSAVQIAIQTGYVVNGGGFNNALSSLRSKGLIEGEKEGFRITMEGREAAGPVSPLPTGTDLIAYWQRQLPKAEGLILGALLEVYPGGLAKDALAEKTGYQASGGGFNNAISRLRTLSLICGREELRLSEDTGS